MLRFIILSSTYKNEEEDEQPYRALKKKTKFPSSGTNFLKNENIIANFLRMLNKHCIKI